MNLFTQLSQSNWTEQIGWTLLHSTWQIALLAIVYALVSQLLKQQQAAGRYLLGCCLFVLMLGIPAATFVWLSQETTQLTTNTMPPSPTLIHSNVGANQAPTAVETKATEIVLSERPLSPGDSNAGSPGVSVTFELISSAWRLRIWFPWVTTLWLVGALLFSLRPVWGWIHIRKLQRMGTSPLSEPLQKLSERLVDRLGVKHAIQFFESTLVEIPTVVGYL